MTCALRRRSRAALAASLLVTVTPALAYAADTYDGAAFTLLAHAAVDVTRQQQQLQQASLNLDDNPWYFYLTARSSPARFRFENGQTAPGGLTRLQLGMGTGLGKPSSELGLALGLLVDGAYASEFPVFLKSNAYANASVTQGLFYANASVRGVSFSFGALISSTSNIRSNGEMRGVDDRFSLPCCRAGAPSGSTTGNDGQQSTSYTFSARHKSGVGIGAATAELTTIGEDGKLTSQRALATLLARVQPEDLFRRYGLFLVGLDRLAPEVDYYSDRYVELRKALAERAAGRPAIIPGTPRSATYELPLGVDNLVDTGVRIRFIAQLAPTAKARLFELAEVQSRELADGVEVEGGARGVIFSRAGSYVPSVDVFAGLRLWKAASWTFSYSYNSPDSLTFFPVPDAHVIGFQVVYGPIEVAQPLVPLLGRGAPKKSGAEPGGTPSFPSSSSSRTGDE